MVKGFSKMYNAGIALKTAGLHLFLFIEWKPEFIFQFMNGNQNLFQFTEWKPKCIPIY